MSPHWIGFVAFLAVIMILLASIPVGQSLALDDNTTGPVQTLMSYQQIWSEQDWGRLVNPITHINFFSHLFSTLIGEKTLYAIFPEGSPWLIVWWICMAPIIATVAFGVALVFISILQRVI